MNGPIVRMTVQGLDERTLAPIDALDAAHNVAVGDTGAWETAPGSGAALWTIGTTRPSGYDDARCEVVYCWSQRGARQWLLFEYVSDEGNRNLRAFNGGDDQSPYYVGLLDQLTEPRANTRYGTTFCPVGGWLWVLNGEDRPFRWDGDRTEPVGWAAPPPPPRCTSSLDGAAFRDELLTFPDEPAADTRWYADPRQAGVGETITNDTANEYVLGWRYAYAIAWVNDLGQESEPSPLVYVAGESSAVTVANPLPSRRMVFVAVPEAPPGTYGVRIYRSQNLAPVDAVKVYAQVPGGRVASGADAAFVPLYLAAELAAGQAFTWLDTRPDSQLGRALDFEATGPVPSGARLAASYAGHVFVAGDTPGVLHYSAPLLPEQFPPLNQLAVQGGQVTALVVSGGSLLVFSERAVHVVAVVDGTPTLQPVATGTGCVSPRAAVDVPNLGVAFLSTDGPYVALRDGGGWAVRFIGAEVRRTWERRASKGSLRAACAGHHARRREVWFQFPSSGNLDCDYGLVWHYDRGVWSTRSGFTAQCFAETQDDRRLLLYASWTPGNMVRVVTGGYTLDDAASVVTGTLDTSSIPLSELFVRSDAGLLHVYHISRNREVAVSVRKDHAVAWSSIGSLGALTTGATAGQVGDAVRPLWGTATWDTSATWTDYPPAFERKDLQWYGASPFVVQFRLQSARLGVLAIGPQRSSPGPAAGDHARGRGA